MKYRILAHEELLALEKELIAFLIVNGVHSEEWEKLNKDEPQKATELIQVFSDTVLQKVYEKIQFLEWRSDNICMVYSLQKEWIELIIIKSKNNSSVKLNSAENIHIALTDNWHELELFHSSKKYDEDRELFIHKLIEKECLISNELFWSQLKQLIKV
jgi:hypothetical protein